MKSRKHFVVAVLLVAALCIGVGYATISQTLTVNGTTTYAPVFDVTWDKDSAKLDSTAFSGSNTVSTSDSDHTLSLALTTTDWTVGDEHVITVSIKNDSNYKATGITVSAITQGLATTNGDDVTWSTSLYTVSVDSIADINAGGTGTATIRITMNSYPVTASSYGETFSFTISATQG